MWTNRWLIRKRKIPALGNTTGKVHGNALLACGLPQKIPLPVPDVVYTYASVFKNVYAVFEENFADEVTGL